MAKQKGNWYQYDLEFRKSKCQFQVTWGNMHNHLWLTHMLSDRQDNGGSPQNGQFNTVHHNNVQVPRIPLGYCVRYHQGNFCQLPCQYNHRCYVCNLPHPSGNCWHQQGNVNSVSGYGLSSVSRSTSRFNNFRPFQSSQSRFRSPNSSPRFVRSSVSLINDKLPTPVKVDILQQFLVKCSYDEMESAFGIFS